MEPGENQPAGINVDLVNIEVTEFPFIVSKHAFSPELGNEGSESGEGEGGEGSSEGGSNG